MTLAPMNLESYRMKTRFCPSPTGNLHVGNMRTALFNYLLAKKESGDFLLRIEDTDQERSKSIYTDAIYSDLKKLGLQWDEGPDVKEKHSQYFQSQRTEVYQYYYDILLERKEAYFCFCTEEELKVSKKLQVGAGQPPKYSGKCKNLSDNEVTKKIADGLPSAIRFKVPGDKQIEFTDLVKGMQKFSTNDIGDFIIKKTNGTASFMFANAVDDALMNTTLVMRGEDHLSNTPRQIMILDYLNLPLPDYAHISTILGKDRQPLSKRNGSQSIESLLKKGYLPKSILNYLARIGHSYLNNDVMNLKELADQFDMKRLVKSPAVFDDVHLNAWQKNCVLSLSDQEFTESFINPFKERYKFDTSERLITALRNNLIFPHEVSSWFEVFFLSDLKYDKDNLDILINAGIDFFTSILENLDDGDYKVKKIYKYVSDKLSIKGKSIYLPLRIALTNNSSGMELQEIMDIMGKDNIKNRFENVIKLLKKNENL